jgi:hypothetical protein
MTHILPRHPHDEVRERYRELAVEDRPGDPNAFDPRPTPTYWRRRALIDLGALIVCASWVAVVWWVLSGMPVIA